MPEPFSKTTSRVIAIPRSNIDTDQICPARFLKITDKAGLADALFFDWRFTPDGTRREPPSFIDEPHNAGRQILLVGRQLRLRVVARARALGAARVGHPGHLLDELRRHLQGQRPEERAAADRRLGRPAGACALVAADPDGEWTVDLEAQKVTLPDGEHVRLRDRPLRPDDDPGRHRRDRLRPLQAAAIEAWEAATRPASTPAEGAARGLTGGLLATGFALGHRDAARGLTAVSAGTGFRAATARRATPCGLWRNWTLDSARRLARIGLHSRPHGRGKRPPRGARRHRAADVGCRAGRDHTVLSSAAGSRRPIRYTIVRAATALLLAVALLGAPAGAKPAAAAGAGWYDGLIQYSYVTNCVSVIQSAPYLRARRRRLRRLPREPGHQPPRGRPGSTSTP